MLSTPGLTSLSSDVIVNSSVQGVPGKQNTKVGENASTEFGAFGRARISLLVLITVFLNERFPEKFSCAITNVVINASAAMAKTVDRATFIARFFILVSF